jgi:hypothetical protein
VSDEGEGTPLDYGLIAPISLPSDSKVPDPASGASTSEEYDAYFRILRDAPDDLLSWSRTCLAVQERLLDELERTSLDAEDKCEILRGFLLVQRITLQRWVKAGEEPEAHPIEEEER